MYIFVFIKKLWLYYINMNITIMEAEKADNLKRVVIVKCWWRAS